MYLEINSPSAIDVVKNSTSLSEKSVDTSSAAAYSIVSHMENTLGDIVEKRQPFTLREQFNSGELQIKILLGKIDPSSIIHQAVLENAPEVVAFLLAKKAKIECVNEFGATPLVLAVYNKHHAVAEVLLAKGANANFRLNDQSLLEYALNNKDYISAAQLIAHGADVNVANRDDGESLLTIVISNALISLDPELIKIASLLIAHGADVNVQRRETDNLLADVILRASSSLNPELIKLAEEMIDKGANFKGNGAVLSGAIELAHKGKPSLLQLLIQKGADLNMVIKNTAGQEIDTPLLAAIAKGDLSLVKLLVEKGADVNKSIVFHNEVRTPLHFAKSLAEFSDNYQYTQIVQYLVQKGAFNNVPHIGEKIVAEGDFWMSGAFYTKRGNLTGVGILIGGQNGQWWLLEDHEEWQVEGFQGYESSGSNATHPDWRKGDKVVIKEIQGKKIAFNEDTKAVVFIRGRYN